MILVYTDVIPGRFEKQRDYFVPSTAPALGTKEREMNKIRKVLGLTEVIFSWGKIYNREIIIARDVLWQHIL